MRAIDLNPHTSYNLRGADYTIEFVRRTRPRGPIMGRNYFKTNREQAVSVGIVLSDAEVSRRVHEL